MANAGDRLWVEPVGDLIIARSRGVPTEEVPRECQERVLALRAIVVPDAKLAYLARLAFGEDDYRVFYGDMTAAVRWLGE